MTMQPVVYLPAASAEINSVYWDYETVRSGLGVRFADEVREKVSLIRDTR